MVKEAMKMDTDKDGHITHADDLDEESKGFFEFLL